MSIRFNARTNTIETDASAIDFTQPVTFPAATTSIPSVNMPHGTAPSAPTDGDVWTTTSGMYVRVNGGTVGPLGAGGGGVSASGTPVNNQLAIWTNASTIEGDANLTYTGTSLAVYGDQTASIIDAQDETFYDNSPTTEGTFSGGTGHAVSDVITLSDGSTITVDAVSTGVVTQFTVTTNTVTPFVFGATLTQTGTTGTGASFSLTPDADNVTFTVTTHHLGINATNRLSVESGSNYGRFQVTDDAIDATACNMWFDLNSSSTGNHSFYWSDGGFGTEQVLWIMDQNIYRFDGGLELIERADHAGTNISGGRGQLWVKTSGGGGELMYSEGDWDVDYTVQNMMIASYRFDTDTTATDPGAGDIKFNSGTASSVTSIYINDAESTTRDNDFMLGQLSVGDIIKLRGPGISAGTPVWWVGRVSGAPTDNSGWWTIPVTHIANSGSVFNSGYPVHVDVEWLGTGTSSTNAMPSTPLVYFLEKSGDENVNNSTTLQDDDHLTISNIPQGRYRVEMVLSARDVGVTGCGLKIDMTATGSGTGESVAHVWANNFAGASSPAYDEIGAFTDTFDVIPLDTGSGTSEIMFLGYIDLISSTNAITLQWAQNSAQVGDLRLEAGSWMCLTRLGG